MEGKYVGPKLLKTITVFLARLLLSCETKGKLKMVQTNFINRDIYIQDKYQEQNEES